MPEPAASARPPDVRKRVFWLVACILTGLAIGWAGSVLAGSAVWFLAVPGAVAVGWLFIADPTRCEQQMRRRSSPPASGEETR
jgi:hypothetical protein